MTGRTGSTVISATLTVILRDLTFVTDKVARISPIEAK